MSSSEWIEVNRSRGHGRRDVVCAAAPVQPTLLATSLGQPAPANSLNELPPIVASGRGRGSGAQPIQPTPPARVLDQAPSNSSGAFQYNGSSASLNQFRPIAAVDGASQSSTGSTIPCVKGCTCTPALPVPLNHKLSYAAATKAGLTV